jgi:hypothetical protein
MKKRASSKPNACFVLKRRRAGNWPKAELKKFKKINKKILLVTSENKNLNFRQFAINFLFHASLLPFRFLIE